MDTQQLPVFEVQRVKGGVAAVGVLAVPLAANHKLPKLDLRDLPTPPVSVYGHKPR